MASTTFIDNQTTIYAAWLNDVNNAVYNGIFVSPSITATSMVCNGTASGAGFTNLINNTFTAPGPIGSVTPSTGRFTTLQANSISGLTTPLSIGQGGTGLTSVGTSGYALASNGSGLAYRKLGLGMTGEVWNDVTGSRTAGTTYTNSNSYPISVTGNISRGGGAGNMDVSVVVNGVTITTQGVYTVTGGGNWYCTVNSIVPAGATYTINTTGSGFGFSWLELY